MQNEYQPVVFSGSVKSIEVCAASTPFTIMLFFLPFSILTNFTRLMNGTVLPADDIHLVPDAVIAVKSIFPEEPHTLMLFQCRSLHGMLHTYTTI